MRSILIGYLAVLAIVFSSQGEAQTVQGTGTAASADVIKQIAGTWGIPPDDNYIGLSGSYFGVSWEEGRGPVAEICLNPKQWSCSIREQQVSWNSEKMRFELPGQPGASCWVMPEPQGDTLQVTIRCPYYCTDSQNAHSITLERISGARLIPPADTVSTFCISHDTLRQQFCTPGVIQDRVAQYSKSASRAGALGDNESEKYPDIKKVMLEILAACHARGGDRPCLQQELDARLKDLETTLATRQKKLAEERHAGEAAAFTLGAADRKAWEGQSYMVTDDMLGYLTIEHCEEHTCKVTLRGSTNYTFGRSMRSGFCDLAEQEAMRFVDATHGFVYLLPSKEEPEEPDAGTFTDYCRIDIVRAGDGFRVDLRGAGCQESCLETAGHGLEGDYHPLQAPSFECHPEEMPWDEENICGDPELAQLDRDLASAFEKAIHNASGASRNRLVLAQKAWLRSSRDDCNAGERRICLVKAYQKRLQELRDTLKAIPGGSAR